VVPDGGLRAAGVTHPRSGFWQRHLTSISPCRIGHHHRCFHLANPYVFAPRLSRDGARVALYKYTGRGGLSLWSFDFKRASLSLIDEDGGQPAWSADDQQILYYAYTHEVLVRKELNSAQPAEVIAKLDQDPTGPIDWSPDAKFAVVQGEVWNVASGHRVPSRLPHFMGVPRFSPNGKWLAYESADGEIVCQDFPEARTRIQVSNRGGVARCGAAT
jgi:Tol biopolymer transport system component